MIKASTIILAGIAIMLNGAAFGLMVGGNLMDMLWMPSIGFIAGILAIAIAVE